MNLRKEDILGVGVNVDSEEVILEYIAENLQKSDKHLSIFTPNPEILVRAAKDPEYRNMLNSADILLPDGIGLVIGGKILGKQLRARIAGADFMERLCQLSARLNGREKASEKSASKVSKQLVTTGFLGGQSGVAELAAECLRSKYPGVSVNFASNEWDESKNKERIDILFVAFGAPKQEKWIFENINKINVGVVMGVGGSFDYISGRVVRAPRLIRKIGFEWMFRLAVQPWRWRRQLALLEFLRLVIFEKFARKKSPSKIAF